MAYQTVNPYDNQIVATFDDLTDEQATTLIRRRRRRLSPGARHRSRSAPPSCRRAAAILPERSDEFARLLTLEMGKLYTESPR